MSTPTATTSTASNPTAAALITVALVGNPNAGKSTLFNALSGLRQHVGNYPGVTVEMKKGHFYSGSRKIEIIDLPGTYSLAARSPDELVAVDLLLGRRPEEPAPDVIVAVVDASNLDRHLYLTTQLMELGRPVVLAVNMMDLAANQGMKIDAQALARETGLVVVPVQANRGIGLDQLRAAIIDAANGGRLPVPPVLPASLDAEAASLLTGLNGEVPAVLARRLLLDVGSATERWFVDRHGQQLVDRLTSARQRLADAGTPVSSLEAKVRYSWIRGITSRSVSRPTIRPTSWSDRLDRYLTHRVWGTLFFLIVMFLLFQAIFVAAEPLMNAIDMGTKAVGELVTRAMPTGPLRSLLTDGILTGVGGVIKFLPQILILFAIIAVLEDCGYMARAAYLMDRLMSRCGLSGKSFIPLLSSVACAVPGIMATRVIENRRDRLATIVVAPLMSCSARLPVYSLLIRAFLTDDQPFWLPGLVLFCLYLIGFVAAPLVALLLRRTLLRGERAHFLMELPSYKRPSPLAVLRRVVDAGWAFIRRAGTLILMSMILVWALLYFPNHGADSIRYEERLEPLRVRLAEATETSESLEAEMKKLEKDQSPVPAELAGRLDAANQARDVAARPVRVVRGEWKRNSYLGQLGRALEPIFVPLGWDWRVGTSVLASFPAREVFVGTLAIIYEADEDDKAQLGEKIRDDWAEGRTGGLYPIPTALSVLVFFALCCQCASTLAVIRRETRSWSWPIFTFVYMTLLAYLAAFATYSISRLF